MGDKVMLTVEERAVLGKKVKQLRKRGIVPAVIYGGDMQAVAVQAPTTDAEKVWREAGKRAVVEIDLGGKKSLAMIKSADVEPVKRRLRHLSFHTVKQNEKVDAEVPVRVRGEGETPAEKAGLVILQAIEAVEVSAFPKDLPEAVEVPGEKLVDAGDHLTVADIIPQPGVAISADPDQMVVSVYEPSALAAANDAAGGDATEDTVPEAENGDEETPAEPAATDEKK